MPDVNVLVEAYRTDGPHHDVARDWLEVHVSGVEAVGITDAVLSGFVRVVTHPRVFAAPTPLTQAIAQADALRAADGVLSVAPGRRHWSIFCELCKGAAAKGNLVADAAHAATAIEAGATWVSFDRDFARFPGLTWTVPT
ncbi:type II toxin-antitoxin system VapC family toxin [Flexivirga oryzae]|uniref:Ribonuclease VapC n=1 Tax=Flexivirga oryzae TaxID=1794944 RepID=A0A839NDW2_9MICO|nr:type II toxin-antitoxin system VapC family toxin [Flexivirga oryzae]MBB2894154.1 hypothetical protein [Flexivirga oryzae]